MNTNLTCPFHSNAPWKHLKYFQKLKGEIKQLNNFDIWEVNTGIQHKKHDPSSKMPDQRFFVMV